MKSMKRVFSVLLAVFMLVTMMAGCGGTKSANETTAVNTTAADTTKAAETTTAPAKDVTLSFLMCWNGASSYGMSDTANNLVAQKYKEKTGVSVEIEYITTPEIEKLNLIFASGSMPDIVNAPYWGGTDPATQAIKKAAKEGMLLDLKPLLDQYGQNLLPAYEHGISIGYKENDVLDPEFGGKLYVLPQQAPATNEDVKNWGGGIYCRQDILKSLNIDPASINTADALYETLKKIKEGNFKDINGKAIIPSGAWGNGWDYVEFWRPFRQDRRGDLDYVDGKFVYRANNPNVINRVLFIRKLIQEGLFDKECLHQTDTQGKEKMATGSYAMVGNHYFHIRDAENATLYKTNPEMHYVAIGPLPWEDGKTTVVEMPDRNGTPVLFLPKTCKDPEAAIQFLNYVNSDEGQLLAYYGVEGQQYTMVDGKPRMTKEWLEKWKADPKQLYDMGIRSTFKDMICLDKRLSAYGELELGEADNKDPYYEQACSVRKIEFKSGYTINDVTSKYPELEKVKPLIDWTLYTDTCEKAYFAKTEAEARKIISDFQAQLKKGGVEDYEKWVTDEMAKHPDYVY
jgi:ABC-type sugar transport system, periplasmic component